MRPDLTIFWPSIDPPQIEEVEFSYQFCHNKSKELCTQNINCVWQDYHPEQSMQDLLAQSESERILLITDPEVLLAPGAVSRLMLTLDKTGKICGPMFNQTAYTKQQASLPAPYVNISTYQEVVNLLATRPADDYQEVDSLDPACVMYARNYLTRAQIQELSHLLVQEFIEKITSSQAVVDKGAFVHCFRDYYQAPREDLIQLLPEKVSSILDVGCALGGYGQRLKGLFPGIYLTGVELNPVMAKSATQFYDQIITSPVEEVSFNTCFDLINCGDVLEHMQDPWSILKRFHELLTAKGYLITSIPNVGHWSIVRDLMQGRFEYIPVGLLCITHIRWFTEESIKQALFETGFEIETLKRQQIKPTPKGEEFISQIKSLGYANEQSLRTNEFLIRAVKK